MRIDGTPGFHPSAKAGSKIVKLTDDPSASPRVKEAMRLVPTTGENYGDSAPADVAGPPWGASSNS
jgi:hypothetical protein